MICWRTEKVVEHESDSDTNSNLSTWIGLQKLVKGSERVGHQRMNQDHPDNSIVEISQNTEKSPRELKRLAVTQTQANAGVSQRV